MYWVRVSCEFQCRACGHLSPLNYLDLDGSVKCLRCGLDQAFARSSWKMALEHAHAVGDLGGSPEGRAPHPQISIARDNPFAAMKSARHQQSGFAVERGVQVPTSLGVTAEIGDPTCAKCKLRLNVVSPTPGEIRTSCPGCGEARSYRLPPEASALMRGLVGVMAGEHRTDQLMTRVEEDLSQPGVVALKCPGCGAGLPTSGGSRQVTCGFCRTVSRLPEKTFYRGGREVAKTEPWWVAFDGPSLRRKRLERDPNVPREDGDNVTDANIEKPPKRKKPRPADLMLVILLPVLLLIAVALADFLVLGQLELDLGL